MKTFISSIYMSILLIPFIASGYFEWNSLIISIIFYFFQLMIIQYYEMNQKTVELKDFIFAFCFTIITVLIYRLFHYEFNINQIVFILLISILSVIQVGCNNRIHVEIA